MAASHLETEKARINPVDIQLFEGYLLRVPYEQMRRSNRSALRHTEKELSNIGENIKNIISSFQPPDQIATKLDALVDRMRKLKRKLKDLIGEEAKLSSSLCVRVNHLAKISDCKTVLGGKFLEFVNLHFKRNLVDHLLRNGFMEIGKKLSETYKVSDLTDFDFYSSVNQIEMSLKKRSSSECLAWCFENRQMLREKNSTLEFQIRLLEFVELARNQKFSECMQYARKHLSQYSENMQYMNSIKSAMVLISLSPHCFTEKYAMFFSDDRWAEVSKLFVKEITSMHTMSSCSIFEATLMAGASALKTSACLKDDWNSPSCPVCSMSELYEIVKVLPMSHHLNSSIICPLSKSEIKDPDYPVATPDGYVYSYSSVKQRYRSQDDSFAKAGGQEFFNCPRTGKSHPSSKLRRLYLM